MATCHLPHASDADSVSDALHQLKQLAHDDPAFAEALRKIETTEQAAELIAKRGLALSVEALWRHRGTLVEGGRPTWRG